MFPEEVIGGSGALLGCEALGDTLSPLASLGKRDAAMRLLKASSLSRIMSTIDASPVS